MKERRKQEKKEKAEARTKKREAQEAADAAGARCSRRARRRWEADQRAARQGPAADSTACLSSRMQTAGRTGLAAAAAAAAVGRDRDAFACVAETTDGRGGCG